MPALLRRRQVWLPTLWGWLVLLLACGGALLVLGLGAYQLLAPQQPARGRDGAGARTLVVEGWLNEGELAQALQTIRRGRYERVLTAGGPIERFEDAGPWGTFAQRAAAYLRAHGAADAVPVIAVPAPASAQDRTYLSAVMVRDWARQAGVSLDAIDLYSAGVHARRSWLVYRMALGAEVEVGVLAARPAEFDAEHWWTSSLGAKSTLNESLSLGWTKCCFWPGAAGSHEERWAVPAPGPK